MEHEPPGSLTVNIVKRRQTRCNTALHKGSAKDASKWGEEMIH